MHFNNLFLIYFEQYIYTNKVHGPTYLPMYLSIYVCTYVLYSRPYIDKSNDLVKFINPA